MNTRLFYIVLAVQVFFAGSLVVLGTRARENRRIEYMEQTYLVTSGFGSAADFEKLSTHLGPQSDTRTVRALFGLPVVSASEIQTGSEKDKLQPQKGSFWIYYFYEPPGAPIDADAAKKLSGPQRVFLVSFNSDGFAKASVAWVQHPF
jgi:hypothetical protein